MESHEIDALLGSGLGAGRRSTLFSLYRHAAPRTLEEDSALVKTLLFREAIERAKKEGASLYSPERSLTYQAKRLEKAGYAAAACCSTSEFNTRIEALSAACHSLPAPEAYNISYLLVVPFSLVPLKAQLAGIKAQHFLQQEDVTSTFETPTPEHPYLIANVSAGELHKGLSVSEALPLLEAAHRLPLALEECIALLTQTRGEVLDYHNLIAAGTLHQNAYVPDLYRAGIDKIAGFSIKLKRELPTNAHPNWGIPSCSARVAQN